MTQEVLTGGFSDPAREAAHAFRHIMMAIARPGSSHTVTGAIPPAPLSPAAGTLILTLCDGETPIFLAGALDCESVRHWIAFHTGAPYSTAESCCFAIGAWHDLLPLARFPIGRSDYPDRSATLIVETATTKMIPYDIRGPGLKEPASIALPSTYEFVENASYFPLGLDFFFTDGHAITALPRTTQIKAVQPLKEHA